jgi:hypothetical protein
LKRFTTLKSALKSRWKRHKKCQEPLIRSRRRSSDLSAVRPNNEIAALDRGIAKVQAEIADLELAILAASSETERPEDEEARLKSEQCERVLKEYRAVLRQYHLSTSSPVDATRQFFEKFENTARDLREERDTLRDEIAALTERIARAQRRRDRARRQRYDQLSVVKTELDQLSKYLSDLKLFLKADIHAFVTLMQQSKKKLVSEQKRVQRERADRIAALTQQEKDLSAQIKRLQRENAREEARQDDERKQRARAAADAAARKAEIDADCAETDRKIETVRNGVARFATNVSKSAKLKFTIPPAEAKKADEAVARMVTKLKEFQAREANRPRPVASFPVNEGKIDIPPPPEMLEYGAVRKRALATMDPAELKYLTYRDDILVKLFKQKTEQLAKDTKEMGAKVNKSRMELQNRRQISKAVIARKTTLAGIKPPPS